MARPIFAGFESGEDVSFLSNGLGLTHGDAVVAPSTAAARVYRTATAPFSDSTSGGIREGYGQFRFKIDRLQTDGDGSALIFELRNAVTNPSAMPGIVINSSGELLFYTYGIAPESSNILMLTSSALTVGQWYLIEFYTLMNTAGQIVPSPPYETNAVFTAWVDGVSLGTYSDPDGEVTSPVGIHATTGSFQAIKLCNEQLTVPFVNATNGIYCFDDLIIDSVARCNNEHIIGLRPDDLGTYTEWTNPTYGMANNITINTGSTSSTAEARVSYSVPTLRSLGINGPTIGDARLMITGSATGAGAGLFVVINGVETLNTVNLAVAATANRPKSSMLAVTIQPDDVVEIGYQKDNTVTARTLYSLVLCVSVADADVSIPAPDTDVETGFLQYTGDGASALLVTLPFEPDLLIVVPAGGTTNRFPFLWDSSNRTTTQWTTGTLSAGPALMVMRGKSKMYVTNAMAGTGLLNTTGVVYDVLAIRDASRRVIQTSDFIRPTSEDDFDVTLPDATYPIDFTMISSRSPSAAVSIIHGTSAVGDLSYSIANNVGGKADFIQSVGTGVVQIGSHAEIVVGYYNPILALSTQRFVTTELIDMVAWTGDGVSPRDIPLNINSTAKLVLVFPIASGAANNGRGAHIRSPGFASADSRRLVSSGAVTTTGITALGTGEFTVQSDCNLTGQTYQALVIFEGVDVTCPVITIVPGSPLANGAVGTGWALTVAGSGGTGPYTFALLSGALPDGLTLSSAELISGIPTVVAAFAFAIRATDSIPCSGAG